MKKKEYIVNERQWLNPTKHADTGALAWYAKRDSDGIDMELCIRDCSRQITLDLGGYNKKAIKQRLMKLALIKRAVTELEEAAQGWLDEQ